MNKLYSDSKTRLLCFSSLINCNIVHLHLHTHNAFHLTLTHFSLDPYEDQIGQSVLPPISHASPTAYRGLSEGSPLSPILSVGSSDNDNPCVSSMTQVSNNTLGESMASELDEFTDDETVIFTRPLSDIRAKKRQLCHFVCQINFRPRLSQFIWRHNGRSLSMKRTLVTG